MGPQKTDNPSRIGAPKGSQTDPKRDPKEFKTSNIGEEHLKLQRFAQKDKDTTKRHAQEDKEVNEPRSPEVNVVHKLNEQLCLRETGYSIMHSASDSEN